MGTLGYIFAQDDGSVGGVTLPMVQVLSQITGINFKATGQTTLYTVPANKNLIITSMPAKVTASSVFLTPFTARIGIASAYTEYMVAVSLVGLANLGNYTDLAVTSLIPIHNIFPAGSVIKLDITIGAGATTLTGAIDVIGYLY